MATFGLKKHAIQPGDKDFFDSKSFETFGRLTPSNSQLSIPSLVVLRCSDAAQRCLKVLKFQQRGYVTQGNFSISSKFKLLPKPPDMLAIFRLVSYLKTVLRCWQPFSHNKSISAGHFCAKKNMPYSRVIKNLFALKSYETYGGLTGLTFWISIPSFIVLRCPAATQRCLKD